MKFFDNVDIITSRSIHHMPYMAIFYIIVLLAYIMSFRSPAYVSINAFLFLSCFFFLSYLLCG